MTQKEYGKLWGVYSFDNSLRALLRQREAHSVRLSIEVEVKLLMSDSDGQVEESIATFGYQTNQIKIKIEIPREASNSHLT